MRSSYLIFLAGFCLAFAASACSSDSGGGAAGEGGSGGSAGEGGSGGSAGSGGEGGAGPAIGGEFRTYNTLVPVLAGCETPDLSGNPDANIADITKCIIVTPPDIGGFMTFTNTGDDAWDVTGRQDLTFKLEIQIGGADATITTNSSTAFSGSGLGSVADGGSLTLDDLAAPNAEYNINAAVTGTVVCEAVSNVGAGAACTVAADCLQVALGQTCTDGECDPVDLSASLCPAANLDPGLNELPFDDDPGVRFFPVLNFAELSGELNMQMGDGPENANGWYIGDPANGTQFTTLLGPVTVEGAGGTGGSGGAGGAGGAGGGN